MVSLVTLLGERIGLTIPAEDTAYRSSRSGASQCARSRSRVLFRQGWYDDLTFQRIDPKLAARVQAAKDSIRRRCVERRPVDRCGGGRRCDGIRTARVARARRSRRLGRRARRHCRSDQILRARPSSRRTTSDEGRRRRTAAAASPPAHTLPTSGAARFSSGLRTADYLRTMSLVQNSPERMAADAEPLAALADFEGLPAHARTARMRGPRQSG
jgi:Histidinol dehydrogenase